MTAESPSPPRRPEFIADPQRMHRLLAELFPVCRSLTGNGVRWTLRKLAEHLPLRIHEVPSGTKAFDWTVPKEWNIRDAYIADADGQKIVDFQRNNLHVVGYSIPVDRWMSLQELSQHLHSLEDQPDAIPYVTSYYQENWGFCLTHRLRRRLKPGKYRVHINSELKRGRLSYGECIFPGKTRREIFLSTYVCHPSMANNELSGPVIAAFIAQWIASAPRRYTYRIVFVPETIGAIIYLSKHAKTLQEQVVAGFNLSCLGDELGYSYVASPYENTLADKVASHVLSFRHPNFVKYPFLARGSDERQYCSPGVRLPLVTLSRSKFGTYPEYHTSLDDIDFVTPKGLQGGYELVLDCLKALEANRLYKVACLGEPQLGKRGLYPNLSTKKSGQSTYTMMNLIAYADGNNDLLDIADRIHAPVWELEPLAEKLRQAGLFLERSRP